MRQFIWPLGAAADCVSVWFDRRNPEPAMFAQASCQRNQDASCVGVNKQDLISRNHHYMSPTINSVSFIDAFFMPAWTEGLERGRTGHISFSSKVVVIAGVQSQNFPFWIHFKL